MKQTEKKPGKSNWVSASDVGRAAFCPYYLVHKQAGTSPSRHAEIAREKGTQSHQALNQLVQDSRCYIASALYGPNDKRTQCLRDFRDRYLLRHWVGRIFVTLYYYISPTLVVLSRHCQPLRQVLQTVVDAIVKRITGLEE